MVLVKLIPDPEKIRKKQFRARELSKFSEHREDYENVYKNGDNLDFYFLPMNANQDDEFKDAPDGFYIERGHCYIDAVTSNANYRKIEYDMSFAFEGDEDRRRLYNYGYCNNWKDVVDFYPELNCPDREFCVLFTPIFKEDGEFRIRESGDRIVELDLDGDSLWEYHICEFVNELGKDKMKRNEESSVYQEKKARQFLDSLIPITKE